MMKLSYEEAISKIKSLSNLSDDEINSTIQGKLEQFAGLVSKEGAAHIMANELGIKLMDNTAISKLKLSNLVVGMQNVEVLAKVLAVYPVREFSSNGRSGQVGSAVIGDESGTSRAVFWNEQANKLGLLNKGDVLKLQGVYAKENRNKQIELHFNSRSVMIVNPPGETVEVKDDRSNMEAKSRRLSEITESDTFVEVVGTVIDVFDLRFYEICSKCSKRSRPDSDGVVKCPEHGEVTPDYGYVLNIFLDDGSGALRTVFFRNNVQMLLGKSDPDILLFKENPDGFDKIKNDVLGTVLRIQARVNKNEMFDRIELVANNVSITTPEATNPNPSQDAAAAADPQIK